MEARRGRAQRTALIALAATVALTVAKVAVWGATGSLTVLSQALDSAVGIVVLVLVAFAVRIADKPADRTHQYGHAKAENLAALGQMIVLGVFVVVVGAEAIGRLAAGGSEEVHAPNYAIALIAVSLVVDVVRAQL